MKLLKTLNWKSGGSGDILIDKLNKEELTLNELKEIIDNNVSAFHPEHPLSLLNIPFESKREIEILKLYLTFLDYTLDTKRFKYEEADMNQLDSIRFITQKLAYSLMGDFENGMNREYSPLWYSSLIRGFLEVNTFWKSEISDTLGDSILKTWGPDIKVIWKKYSDYIHDCKKIPYIKDDKIDIYFCITDLKLILKHLVTDLFNNIKDYYKDSPLNRRVKNILGWFNLLNEYDELIIKPNYQTIKNTERKKFRIFEFMISNNYMEMTGFYSPLFFRGFTQFDCGLSTREKQTLANCSHRDIYKYLPLNRWDSFKHKFNKVNINSRIEEDLRSAREKIFMYIYDNKNS